MRSSNPAQQLLPTAGSSWRLWKTQRLESRGGEGRRCCGVFTYHQGESGVCCGPECIVYNASFVSESRAAHCCWVCLTNLDPDLQPQVVAAKGDSKNFLRARACLLPPLRCHCTALQTDVVEVLAAMIPCSRLYGFLGCSLAAATSHLGRHKYSDWLDTYSGADYLVSCFCF